MCGIVGYTGSQAALPILLGGLKDLEYRGYDSAGVALAANDGSIQVEKRAGKLAQLESAVSGQDYAACHAGIGHTRWATHGEPSEAQRPPAPATRPATPWPSSTTASSRTSRCCGRASVRENAFNSDTDTEAIAHLLAAAIAHGCGTCLWPRSARLRPSQEAQAISGGDSTR